MNGTPKVIETGPILRLLGGKKAYERFVLEGISESHNEEYYAVEDQRFLGRGRLWRGTQSGGWGERWAQEQEADRDDGQRNCQAARNDRGGIERERPPVGSGQEAGRGGNFTGSTLWL